MILVDTGVIIGLLRGDPGRAVEALRGYMAADVAFALTPIVVQEVMQGARDDTQWRLLEDYMTSQRQLTGGEPMVAAVAAARIFFDCRRSGHTVRSTLDCAIAQVALHHDVPLLQDDRDYLAIAAVRPLRLLP